MAKINSKAKGARFERLLASKFREYGYTDSRRTAQYCGNTGDASDVVGLPYLHIEAKHQEKMYLYDWIGQAKRDAEANGKGNIPAVFHKKNNAEILVTLTFDDFMQIYREFEASRAIVNIQIDNFVSDEISEDEFRKMIHRRFINVE